MIRSVLGIGLIAAALVAMPAGAGEINVGWDAVSRAAGYHVYYGSSSRNYTGSQTVSTNAAKITGLPDCQDTFLAIKAFNTAGESEQFSDELSGWPRPSITGTSPGAVQQGAQLVVDINGANFRSGASVEINNPRVTLASVAVLSCDRIQLLATVEPRANNVAPAHIGRFTVTVVNPDSIFGSRSDAFEVAINPARFDINKSEESTSGRLDGRDTVWLARRFGGREGTASYDPNSDFDGDGWVDGNDLAYIASNLGRCWTGTGWANNACPQGLQ